MLKDNNALIIGIKKLFATFEINDDKNNVNELYVTAKAGFLEAIIIADITGKYALTKIVVVFTPVTMSLSILLIGAIIIDMIIKIDTKYTTCSVLSFSFKKEQEIAVITKTTIIKVIFLTIDIPLSKAK